MSFEPLPGNKMFDALKDDNTIIMACNMRYVPGVATGIFRAAKKLDAAVIMEIARSESDLSGGYTGMTPKAYADLTKAAAKEVGYDAWALHADHITLKKGDEEDVENAIKLIDAQVDAGFTSFAIDASFLFNKEGATVAEQLQKNVEVTTRLAKHIEEKLGKDNYGLEVEVGEIGKEDEHGRVLTTPEEAVAFLKALNENGVRPQVLAIANGSIHGNNYDEQGNLIEQVSIDIQQTVKVADAIREAGLDARIAQHGITGTPRELIKTKFPKKSVLKGNVGTFWQNLVWDVLKICEPGLYKEIYDDVVSSNREAAEKKGITNPAQIFGLNSKKAFGKYFDRLSRLDKAVLEKIDAVAYAEAMLFFDAFDAAGTAAKVREKS